MRKLLLAPELYKDLKSTSKPVTDRGRNNNDFYITSQTHHQREKRDSNYNTISHTKVKKKIALDFDDDKEEEDPFLVGNEDEELDGKIIEKNRSKYIAHLKTQYPFYKPKPEENIKENTTNNYDHLTDLRKKVFDTKGGVELRPLHPAQNRFFAYLRYKLQKERISNKLRLRPKQNIEPLHTIY